MKFSFAFLFVILAVFSLFSGISADVCKIKNQKAAAKACEQRCHAKEFEVGKCVKDSCVCSKPVNQ